MLHDHPPRSVINTRAHSVCPLVFQVMGYRNSREEKEHIPCPHGCKLRCSLVNWNELLAENGKTHGLSPDSAVNPIQTLSICLSVYPNTNTHTYVQICQICQIQGCNQSRATKAFFPEGQHLAEWVFSPTSSLWNHQPRPQDLSIHLVPLPYPSSSSS